MGLEISGFLTSSTLKFFEIGGAMSPPEGNICTVPGRYTTQSFMGEESIQKNYLPKVGQFASNNGKSQLNLFL